MYESGEGVPKDDGEAIKWYGRAARQGNRFAQRRMGSAYENGRGVEHDDARAHAWFSLADHPGDWRLAERTLARLRTDEERDQARCLAAKYREDYVRPFSWRWNRLE